MTDASDVVLDGASSDAPMPSEPQPYAGEDLQWWITSMSGIGRGRLAATLRDYQRVLQENVAMREELVAVLRECANGQLFDPALYVAAQAQVHSVLCALESQSGDRQRRIEQLEVEVAALRADKERLGRFAGKLLAQLRDDTTPDGGDLQDLLAEAGVIAPVQVTEPCQEEGCVCAEYDFPMACYRNTPLGDYCQDAARSGGEEKHD